MSGKKWTKKQNSKTEEKYTNTDNAILGLKCLYLYKHDL